MAKVLYSAFDIVPSPKGAGTHIRYFVRGLTDAGHSVHLFTPGDGILPASDIYEGAQVTRVPPVQGGHLLARAIEFGQAALEHVQASGAYDIMHYRSVWSGLPLAQNKTRFGYRTLFEVNGLPSLELKYHYPGLRQSASTPEVSALMQKIREQEVATLLLSDAVVCPSEVTRTYLMSLGVPSERITVIPNGVTRDFSHVPPAPREGRVPVILYVGTLADWQGLDLLLDALPQVLAAVPARLRMIGRGRGRQRKMLSKKIRKLGLEAHVSMEPAVPHHEIPAVIAASDVCVAPLALNDRNVTQGCCPIKVLEYMAAGRPVVASNLPVVRELVRENVDALLFSPDDPQDLARQLVRALADADLADRLSQSATNRAHSAFTWHLAQKKLLRVYRRLGDV